jgi:hypothetical protein
MMGRIIARFSSITYRYHDHNPAQLPIETFARKRRDTNNACTYCENLSGQPWNGSSIAYSVQSSTLATKRNNDGDMTTPEEKWTDFLKRYLEILSSKTRSTNKGVTAKQAKNMSMADLEISVLCAPKDGEALRTYQHC